MPRNRPDDLSALTSLSNLDDPLRRRLYEYVIESEGAVSRDEAAGAAGIGRTLAAYHLDKLASAELVSVSYERPAGRDGPGAGRPAKLYTRNTREMTVSVPPRDYEFLARLLVTAVEHDDSGVVQGVVDATAREAGSRAGRDAEGDLMAALRGCGYLPRVDDEGCITLRNCPFHYVAKDHMGVVCALNLALVEGVVAGSARRDARVELRPQPERCCVVVYS